MGPLSEAVRGVDGGPARTRTEDQGIHSTPPFPVGVDYLFTPPSYDKGGAGRSSLSLSATQALR